MNGRRRVRQAGVGLVVLALHGLGLLAWWPQVYTLPSAHRDKNTEAIAVWLPALPNPAIRPAGPLGRQELPAPRPKGLQHPPSKAESPSAATAAPSLMAEAAPSASAQTPGVSAPAASPPALDLRLSPKAIASLGPPGFAAQSPFQGRLPATAERIIANAAAQSGPWTEERVDMDHVRFRRGSTCIMMERPRAAALDPFNDAYSRLPWKASLMDCSQP